MNGEPLVYTVSEAAPRLHCHEQSVRKLVKSGELRAISVGRKVLIPRAALEEFVNGPRRAPANNEARDRHPAPRPDPTPISRMEPRRES